VPLPDWEHGVKTGTGTWTDGISAPAAIRRVRGFSQFSAVARRDSASDKHQWHHAVAAVGHPARSVCTGTAGPLRLFIRQLDAGMGYPSRDTAYGHHRLRPVPDCISCAGLTAAMMQRAPSRIDDAVRWCRGTRYSQPAQAA